MSSARPNPDELLAAVNAADSKARRGKLKVFFGANAGVGKTYAMLEEARRRKQEGVDVVVGYVELHGRLETERLLEGLEHLATLSVRQAGVERPEFYLDLALKRKPQLLLIDELAHTNLRGDDGAPRHEKRYQDIEEVLDAGIDVYTTVNVQHLESLNDVIAQITGTRQRETLPDRIFDEADEVELIDLPPDDLLQRLHAGKVYVPDQAKRATESFFRKGNLIALREIALRKTADRVDRAMHEYRKERSVHRPWAARERVLACVGPDKQAERIVRAGKRMADGLDAEWVVVYVETPNLLRLSEAERNRRIALMKLAESLGAETVTLGGSSAASEILEYARTRNVTRIVVGKPNRRTWSTAWSGMSTTNRLIRDGVEFDVVVIGRDYRTASVASDRRESVLSEAPPSQKRRWLDYVMAIAATSIATLICWLMYSRFELSNLVMVYLLSAAIAAIRYGRKPAVLTSILNVLAFDVLFVPPRFSLAVSDVQYLLTFAIMLIVALIIGNLNASVRLQARVAGHRERRTSLLYAMTRQLSTARNRKSMEHIAVGHVSEVFECETALLFPDAAGRLVFTGERHSRDSLTHVDVGAAQWCFDHGKPAGLGTETLAGSSILYVPLIGSDRTQGVLAVKPQNPRRVMLPEQFRLLETFAAQTAFAIERAELADQAKAAEVRAETESVRNSLLAGMSHDLRTPLATIVAGAETLAERMADLSAAERRSTAAVILDAATHVSNHVSSILELVRLESGGIKLRCEYYALDEIVGTVLHRMRAKLDTHSVVVELSAAPQVFVDGKLIEQVIENILDNAVKYTPAHSEIHISGTINGDDLEVKIADNGLGFKGIDPERLFQKFERGNAEGTVGGIGLGLAICRAVVGIHGGRIWAEESDPQGVTIRFTLPLRDPKEVDE